MRPFGYFLPFFALIQIACQKPPVDYNTAMDACKVDTFRHKIGTGIMETYGYSSKCIVGAQLPLFSATTIKGKKIDNEYFTGKISIINFWFIGCHPCEAEMPGLNKLVEKYKSQPVNFLSIGLNSPKDIEDFLAEHPFNFDHIAYGEPIIMGSFKFKWAYPFNMIADENLKIIHIVYGGKTDSTAIVTIQNELVPIIDNALGNL